MIEIVEQINEFGFIGVIIGFLLAIMAFIGIKELFVRIKKTFGWIDIKEVEKQKLEERLKKMEKQIEDVDKRVTDTSNMYDTKLNGFHQQSIDIRSQLANNQDKLSDKVDSLTDMFSKFINRENETTVAMFRSSLWRLHRDFTQQGFVTPDGLKTFMEMGKVYTEAGGNDIYHEKLLPEVEALEIRYPDGGVYK